MENVKNLVEISTETLVSNLTQETRDCVFDQLLSQLDSNKKIQAFKYLQDKISEYQFKLIYPEIAVFQFVPGGKLKLKQRFKNTKVLEDFVWMFSRQYSRGFISFIIDEDGKFLYNWELGFNSNGIGKVYELRDLYGSIGIQFKSQNIEPPILEDCKKIIQVLQRHFPGFVIRNKIPETIIKRKISYPDFGESVEYLFGDYKEKEYPRYLRSDIKEWSKIVKKMIRNEDMRIDPDLKTLSSLVWIAKIDVGLIDS